MGAETVHPKLPMKQKPLKPCKPLKGAPLWNSHRNPVKNQDTKALNPKSPTSETMAGFGRASVPVMEEDQSSTAALRFGDWGLGSGSGVEG